MSSEKSTVIRQFGNERIEVIYRKALPLDTQTFGIELQTPSKLELW
jgi:hypothetical protein